MLRLPLAGRIVIADPACMQHMLLNNRDNYSKDLNDYRLLDQLLGSGLLTSVGKRWQGMRHLLQPLFHLREMPGYTNLTAEVVKTFCARWDRLAHAQIPIDITREMTSLSLMMSAKCLLREAVPHQTAERLVECFFIQHKAICQTGNVRPWLPTLGTVRFHRARKFATQAIDDMIARKRLDPGEDVISFMLHSNNPATGAPYTEQDVFDQASTFLGTGHETTGTGMAWAWYCLANHKAHYLKMCDEVDSVLQNKTPCYEQLAQLTYTHQVFQEAIRLYPPIWGVPRVALSSDVANGYKIPARAKLLLMIYGLHRLPQHWQAPETFNPDRFMKGDKEKRHKYAYLPFGAGPHVCIASLFSQMQAQVAMSMIMQRFRLVLSKGSENIGLETLITLKPRSPIMMHLHRRGEYAQ